MLSAVNGAWYASDRIVNVSTRCQAWRIDENRGGSRVSGRFRTVCSGSRLRNSIKESRTGPIMKAPREGTRTQFRMHADSVITKRYNQWNDNRCDRASGYNELLLWILWMWFLREVRFSGKIETNENFRNSIMRLMNVTCVWFEEIWEKSVCIYVYRLRKVFVHS